MLMVIMLIAVVFAVSEKIDDFFKNSAPLSKILFDYYLNFVLYFSTLLSPLLIFISVIFFTSKLASNTEIVAVLSAGVSFSTNASALLYWCNLIGRKRALFKSLACSPCQCYTPRIRRGLPTLAVPELRPKHSPPSRAGKVRLL